MKKLSISIALKTVITLSIASLILLVVIDVLNNGAKMY